MAHIHLSTSSNGGNLIINGSDNSQNVHVGDAMMPKYVGARAVVDRVENGVRITLIDYKGATQETIAEAITDITTNADGSLTFTLANGDTITSGSLKGPQGDPGPPGEDGEDGHTPVITATKSGKVTTIYVDGTPIAIINDGEGGGVTSVNGETGDVVITVPTKVSDLQNDSGFITSYTETDPTVPSWAKQSSKPTYTASEVGALPDTTSIPAKTSDLTNDSNFVADASYVHTDNNYTSTEKSKLSGIAAGAEVNVQADWDETDSTADAYIANKPDIDTLKVIVVSIASFSSLPQTVSNSAITANHVCIKAELGTPSAQTGDWTVTTSAGSLTISGSISGSTTAKLYLAIAQ